MVFPRQVHSLPIECRLIAGNFQVPTKKYRLGRDGLAKSRAPAQKGLSIPVKRIDRDLAPCGLSSYEAGSFVSQSYSQRRCPLGQSVFSLAWPAYG